MYDRHLSAEFRTEIQMLSKVEHLNLVKFLGHLEHEGERLILVEYVNNGTLREHLDGTRGEPLEFSQRLNIAIDIAHAVAYLHGYTGTRLRFCMTINNPETIPFQLAYLISHRMYNSQIPLQKHVSLYS